MEKAVDKILVTLHGVSPKPGGDHGTLGPIPTTTIEMEGTPTTAIIDTGSPVSIVSLEALVRALAKKMVGEDQDAIKESIKKRLSPSSMQLRGYGGEAIPIVKQGKVKLTRGSYSIEACLQVQSDAPTELLLGTDLQPQLGFQLVDLTVTPSPTLSSEDNLEESTRSTDQSNDPCPEQEEKGGETQSHKHPHMSVFCMPQGYLLDTPRLLPLDPRVLYKKNEDILVFEPVDKLHELSGLVLEEAVVKTGETQVITITNPSYHPICLVEGQVLGHLSSAQLASNGDGGRVEYGSQEVAVNRVSPSKPINKERHLKLMELLQQQRWGLEEQETLQLESLVEEFHDVFALGPNELGCAEDSTHVIDTEGCAPVKQYPRRIPFALRDKVEEMISQMLEQNIISPSKSPWASPIVLVSKKDGSTPFCVDYRKLNALTKKDVYPLPRIDDTLDLLATNKLFSTLDLASGYWQIRMDKSSKEKTAFTTHVGLYEFEVMPFGLCNAPATFQRLMETILHGVIGKACLVYLDDIIVLGKTVDEQLQNLAIVWGRLRQSGLRLKPSKCNLLQEEVEYLGYCVSATGVSTSPKKVTAVQNYPVPSDVKSLRSFLGLVSYYQRFVPNFAIVANPLFALTRKDAPYEWSEACQNAFQRLKDTLASSSVLAFPDFSKEFLLETDASKEGLGAVLSQSQPDGNIRPIAFASRTLQVHEKNYGSTEMEGLAVVWALKHFRQYLYGHRCQVFTDHEALKALLNTPHPSGKLARWGLVIQEMDLVINYRPGKKNGKADALSRYPIDQDEDSEDIIPTVVAAITDEVPSQAGDLDPDTSLRDRQHNDPQLSPIIQFLENDTVPEDPNYAKLLVTEKSHYSIIEGVLYRVVDDGSLRIIPPSQDRRHLFDSAHAGLFAGHLREKKIYGTLSKHYWWMHMRQDISMWCKSCLTCVTRQVGRPIRPCLLPIPVGGPFNRVGVDILQLPKSSHGNQYAVVFMDYLTKWPEVYPV